MAALVAGVQYGLTSQGYLNDNKSLIFVKLTDSALRAIEDYVRNKNKLSQPTIQFLGTEGHLSLPQSAGSSNSRQFKFSLSSSCDIEGPQGSFECIRHTGQKCLERIGSMPCKMRVQANDDSYEVTKNRMAAAEKQHKENCTREIELDTKGNFTRRVKVRSRLVDGGGGTRVGGASAFVSQPTSHPPRTQTNPARLSTYLQPHQPSHQQMPPKHQPNPDIVKRPLKERVIHLLAVRPYKKPELFLALSKDGLKEKDKNNLMSTVNSVATCRENTFHLMRHVWNDVNEDWPFYSDLDRKSLKRRKPANLTPPGSSDGGSSGSPGGSPPAKRPGYIDGVDGLPTKRPRISHYTRPQPPARYSPRPPAPTIITTPPSQTPVLSPSRKLMPHPSPPTPPQEEKTPPKPSPPSSQPPAPYHIPHPHIQTHQQAPKQAVEYPKYLLDYTTIKDSEQRRRYKEDFFAYYNEYKKLHAMVEKVSKRFSQLDEELRKEERGSTNWQRIKDTIVHEYNENKRNVKQQDAKRRFHYLHDKLSHIKRLVMDYDAKGT